MRSHRPTAIPAVVLLASTLALDGCAALPLAVVGGAALQAGGGAVVKAGTEYTASGAVYRTFTIPIADVHAAILETFRRTQLTVAEDEPVKKGQRLVGRAEHRTVKVELVWLTPSLTSMQLVVKRNLLASDRATASELVAQTEQMLAENPAYAPRLDRAPTGTAPR